jgi:site-specific DNA recombinase
LIAAEIDKRLATARTSDPAVAERHRLQSALTKTTATIARMITAFSEQLITIDELRTRMPDLRAREANLRNQIQAIEAQTADHGAYLKLAQDLTGFLSQLRRATDTAAIPERQRILRLLVKDILVGTEQITIRHHIPIRERAHPQPAETDTEGDKSPDCLLRWGRQDPTLRGADISVLHCAGLGHDPGLEERLHQQHDAFVLDPIPHPTQQGRVIDRVETCLDIGIEHPQISLGAQPLDIGDRVVRPTPRPEPIGDRKEISLEDGLQHQLQRRLDHPVGDRRDAQTSELPRPAGFADHALPHRQRPERPVLHRTTQILQEPRAVPTAPD